MRKEDRNIRENVTTTVDNTMSDCDATLETKEFYIGHRKGVFMTSTVIRDYTPVLEERFGKVGSPEWEKSIEEAEAFFIGQMLRGYRREARMTQSELAEKLHVTKSYISRIENGLITPSVTVFYRIIDALGMRVEIVKPIG